MDPTFWKGFQAWEKQASESWANMIRSPEFIDLMNQQMESWLVLKQQLDQATEETLKNALLPSRAQEEHILQLIHTLATQVEELADRVEKLGESVK